MNIGLEKMAQSTPGISYSQLANAKQWRFYKEALTRAQSVLVNYQLKLPVADFWGEGKTHCFRRNARPSGRLSSKIRC